MKVLTATSQTQGWRHNDFCWTVEGELVFFAPLECSRGSVDDRCGCRRSVAGLASEVATTTLQVTDRENLDPETYLTLIGDGLERQGYINPERRESPGVKAWLDRTVDEMLFLADCFPAGTVLERRGDRLRVRRLALADDETYRLEY